MRPNTTSFSSSLYTLMLKVTKMKTMTGVCVCLAVSIPHSTRQNSRKTSNKTFEKRDEERKTTARFPRENVFFLFVECWLVRCSFRALPWKNALVFQSVAIHQTILSTAIFYSSLLIAFPAFSNSVKRTNTAIFFFSFFVRYLAFSVLIHFIYSYMTNVI